MLGLVIGGAVSQSIRQSEESRAQDQTRAVIQQTQSSSSFALEIRFNSIKRLANRWNAVGGIPLDFWKAEAALTVSGLPDVLSMMLIDADGKILNEQTRSGVQRQTAADVFSSAYNVSGLQDRFDRRELIISRPFPSQNGLLVLLGAPLYSGDQFDGYVLAGFAPGELLGAFLADVKRAGYSVSIQDEETLIYNGLLEGDARDPSWRRQELIQFGDNQWQLRLIPTRERLEETFSGLPTFILIGSVLISLTIAYGMDRTMRIKKAERRLRKSNARLQSALREQTALSQDLKMERDRADHASQLKSEFLANMSHEIRTPLNAVIGFSQLLANSDLSKQNAEWIGIVKTSAEDLLSLLSSILELSRIESGQIEISLASCQLEDIFSTIQSQWKDKAKAKEIYLEFSIDPSVPEIIQTDESILCQVVSNLVSNAVKFTDQGGVTVRLDTLTKPDTSSSVLRCSVKDTGIGIDDKFHARLFQKFTQVDGALDRKHGGTGLGLALSKNLAQLLGGDLRFESQPNRGSVFTFDFPYRVEEQEIENSIVSVAFSDYERSIA